MIGSPGKITVEKPYLPSEKRKKKLKYGLILAGIVLGLSAYLEFNFLLLITEFHYILALLQEMFPPNFSLLFDQDKVFSSVLQTISMAFLGTVAGGSLALLLAFLAARNTSPNHWTRGLVRTLLATERVTPNLVVLLVLIIAVGLGPFAGMLSLVIGTVGMFGKLFADAIEQVEGDAVQAIEATGASKMQAIRYGILPEVLPSFVGNLFYAFDINLRAAIGLGVFGGGGIGYELQMAMQMLRYKDALALIFFTVVLISLFEKVSDFLRNKMLRGEVLH